MRKLHIILLLVSFFISLVFISNTSATTSGGIVISEVQLGGPNFAMHEFIEIYNNSETDIEVTNWCLYYQSSKLTQYELSCFNPAAENIHIFLPARSSAFLISNELHDFDTTIQSDAEFSATLAGTAGYVRIMDDLSQEVDRVGWGPTDENKLATAAPSGQVLSRRILDDESMQDTDVYGDDFVVSPIKELYQSGLLYEVIDVCANITDIQDRIPDGYQLDGLGDCFPEPVDICSNLEGFQFEIPANYGLDEFKDCQVDMCLNLDDLQMVIPEDFTQDDDGNCNQYDACLNLELIQSLVPDGMITGLSGDCVNPAAKLILTELLPNAISSDDGNEYIEIYNPNNTVVDLAGYRIYIGANYLKWYEFPLDSVIAPFSYLVFSDDDMGFQLVNTTSFVRLATKDEIIDESLAYLEPKEGESWSLIDDIWQYTNQVTLGFVNIVSIIPESGIVLSATTELAPCAEGYYRNAETNRCRKVVSEESELVPCRDGQYRSEETGRCRNIVSDIVALVPCSEGEERNPATNRCRKVVSEVAISLEPCQSGQERNPETNRCRNIVADTIPIAKYAPEKVVENSNSLVFAWALGFIALLAVSYGVWEWRQEIVKLFRKRP